MAQFEPKDKKDLEVYYRRVVKKVHDCFSEAVAFKNSHKIMNKTVSQWERDLERAYNLSHDAETAEDYDDMKSYNGLLASKVRITKAYFTTKYVRSDGAPLKIKPTPIPELSKENKEKALNRVRSIFVERLLSGGLNPFVMGESVLRDGKFIPEVERFLKSVISQSKDLVKQQELLIAEEAASRMAVVISDKLIENDYNNVMSEVLHDLALTRACITISNEVVMEGHWNKQNKWVETESVKPRLRRVDPKTVFFAPDAKTAHDGSYVIELIKRTRKEVESFIGEDGYIDDQITKVLDIGEDGGLRVSGNWLMADLNIDVTKTLGLSDETKEFYVIKAQMDLTGKEMIAFGAKGIKEENRHKTYNAEVEVIGDYIIRCEIVNNPKGKRTYFSACYTSVPGSPYGISLGMLCYDKQVTLNKIHYFMLKNAYYASGSIIGINSKAIEDLSMFELAPWKSFEYNPDEPNQQPITQTNFQITFGQLMQLRDAIVRYVDADCGIPAFLSGTGEKVHETLGGMAMIEENAQLGFYDAAYNIDRMLEGVFDHIYSHEMVYNEDNSIKGDAKVTMMGLYYLKEETMRNKSLAGVIPSMSQMSQSGDIPRPLYQSTLRDYLESAGIKVNQYMPSSGMQNELNQIATAAPAPPPSGLDGRSLSQMGYEG